VDEPSISERVSDSNSGELDYAFHFMVKKCTEDYENLAFNTAIAAMMVFVNEVYKAKSIYKSYLEGFVQIFSCVCPFTGEEMWERLGHKESIAYAPWPKFDESKLVNETVKIALAINGKTRDVIEVAKDIADAELQEKALANEKVKSFLEGKTVRKVIVVKGKIVNIVAA
jgi:leucyl-tRNA synthetase